MNDTIKAVRQSLTLTEIGVIISLLISSVAFVFTLGVFFGQVNENTQDIAEMKLKVDIITTRIERIDANVEFLAGLAKEERDRR